MKMGRKIIIVVALALLIIFPAENSTSEEAAKHNYKPSAGYVPDSETAIKIAIAVWGAIYGEETIEQEKPYKAILADGIWHVSGSLPDGWVGGVAEAEISKEDGCIIQISHGK